MLNAPVASSVYNELNYLNCTPADSAAVAQEAVSQKASEASQAAGSALDRLDLTAKKQEPSRTL